MKLGGSCLASIETLQKASAHIISERSRGNKVVVVVSAFFGATDKLLNLLEKTTRFQISREADALLATGEQVVAPLMACALQDQGVDALSLQGWQIPILTDAHHGSASIRHINTLRLHGWLSQGVVPVVSGFQGLCQETQSITTLGRGGSDVSAVALAIALGAESCDFYKDVGGVLTADPKKVKNAFFLRNISLDGMLLLCKLGAKILAPRTLALARHHGMRLHLFRNEPLRDNLAQHEPQTSISQNGGDPFFSLVLQENETSSKNPLSAMHVCLAMPPTLPDIQKKLEKNLKTFLSKNGIFVLCHTPLRHQNLVVHSFLLPSAKGSESLCKMHDFLAENNFFHSISHP